MYREIVADMSNWKDSQERTPLLLIGAKGVGKTWVAKDFGAGFFDETIVIDFEQQDLSEFTNFDLMRIQKTFNIEEEKKNSTLLLFENIHLIDAFQLLVFFSENLADYYIICTTFFNENIVFANEDYKLLCEVHYLYPLSFGEFLIVNKEFSLYSKIENHSKMPLESNEIKEIEEYLHLFFYIGGMPFVVKKWLEEKDVNSIDRYKKSIMDSIEEDFKQIPSKPFQNKVIEVWNSIGTQLAKENKKFQFGTVKLTARAREYSEAVEWLYDRGYISKLYKIKDAKSPLDNQKDTKSFEVFMLDVGLLVYQYQMHYNEFLSGAAGLSDFNGALTEQFVYQELLYNNNMKHFYYWQSEATARIGFVFEDSGQVIPIDINIDDNKKMQSLKVFKEKYNTPMSVRLTYEKFRIENGILNIPLYSVWNL